MISLFKTRPEPGALALREVPRPDAAPGEALVKVRCVAICGTDLHIFAWNAWAESNYRPPIPMGHEFCGEVVAVGEGVTHLRTGDRVTAETHLGCGVCPQCRAGRAHTCYSLRLFSKLGCGCFSEYTAVPAAMLRPVPEGVPDTHGAVMEPLGVAARAVDDARVSGSTVLVMGCGPVGLFAVAVAKALGAAQVLAVDVSAQRMELALRVGAAAVFNPVKEDVVACVRAATEGRGVDVVIEASGNPVAIGQCFAALDRGGRMVMVGLPSEPVPIDIVKDIITGERTVIGAYGRRIDHTWLLVERLLRQRVVDVDALLTKPYPLEEYEAAFAAAASGKYGKVLLQPGGLV
ncbi:MAG: zinc-binding dehydrogenase [Planctomycetaceae bacterium]|nr:zinc-binding dehydrogenase [Planctomycetaceae bacterium]